MTRINDSHIGWWCPTCDASCFYKDGDGVHDCCEKPLHAMNIPVFAPLPTPIESTETRADMEADAEVVVGKSIVDGIVRMARPSELGHADDGCRTSRYGLLCNSGAWAVCNDAKTAADDISMSCPTEADAVLWVCEGALPGGES